MKNILVFDATGVLHRTFFAGWKQTGDKNDLMALATHSAFTTLNKYHKKFSPDLTICAFDRPNWRKLYTQSDACISKRIYKANRRLNMTPTEQMRYDEFSQHVVDFEDTLRQYTSIVVASKELLEADDIIAGVPLLYPNDNVTIISEDKDFIQLLRYPNVKLIAPSSDKRRECDDVDWFLFFKCIRGDLGDNVGSAYPKVREVRLRRAFTDEFERLNLMNETWTGAGTTYRVGDLYEENKLLMDLNCQPDAVKDLIISAITDAVENRSKYNHFNFMKFCNRYNLEHVRRYYSNYINMLSS